jgi:prepilin-type N-terminal cleavage/methylation domain-containing protein
MVDSRNRGFTLVELLIAISIFGVVIASVYGSYRATFYVLHNSTARLEMAGKARVALERITDDLYAAAAGEGGSIAGTKNEQYGQRADSLTLVSASYLRIKKDDFSKGHSIVKFFLEYNEESETFDLFRTGGLQLPGQEGEDPAATRYPLCRGVQSLVFSYVDDEGNSEEEWLPEVEEDAAGASGETGRYLPSLVYVRLELREKERDSGVSSVFRTAVSFSSLKGEGD